MSLVVDASIALAWALPDESSVYVDAVLAAVEQESLRVPELWARKVANGLTVAYSRKRITSGEERTFLIALSRLHIEIEEAERRSASFATAAAAIRYGLTAYDAAYVDLASREKLALATLDGSMRKAAEQSGVVIFQQL